MTSFITQHFELILFSLVVLTGVICLINHFWLSKKRSHNLKESWAIEYSRSFFPVLLVVFLIRSFVLEPYRIPSGSLKPTLQIGDYIIANKFMYGLRLPIWHTKILNIEEPKRGDIMLFRWPTHPDVDLIKRVIGVPGDHIVYQNKILTINGQIMPQKSLKYAIDNEPKLGTWKVEEREENLEGIKHAIYVRPAVPPTNFDVTVPPGKYFVLGDNRDGSDDSRYWGFVPEENIIGKAFCILISWNSDTDSVRWSRLGRIIH